MANADGSIRIEATVSDEQAKKQIAQMSKDIEKQTAAVERQAEKVKKLAAQWEKVSSGGARGLKMKSDLEATEAEAKKLAQQLEEVNAKAYSAQAEYSEKLKQAAVGAIPQEEFSESAQRLNALTAESDRLAEGLRKADEKAEQLRQTLAETVESARNSTVGQNIAGNLSNEQTKLENMRAGLQQSKAEFSDFSNTVNEKISQNNSVIGKLKTALANTFGSLKKNLGSGIGAAADKAKNKISSFGKSSAKALDKTGKKASAVAVRLRSIVAGALFFNIISRALTALTEDLGKALLANKDFAKSFGQIKSNLLTAFQPIYDTILPWLNMLMKALAQVTAQMAQFVASVFGTTAQKAQENADALHQQAQATEETTQATKDAEKALASFDTIQKLGDNTEKQEQPKPGEPQFDTDYSQIPMPQWLTDFWKVFQDSWAQYGQATINSAKAALEALKGMVSAIGQSFMSIWTNGTGVETLNSLQFLLQTILGIVGAIANAFRAAWEQNNVGEQMLQTLMNLLNTIIQIIASIGQAFLAAWENGNAGQAMLSAIMTMVQQIASFANSIGQAFLIAWNEAGLGQSIFSHILSIVQNTATAIGNIAEQLQIAWEANNNGVQIWEAILGIIDSIVGTIDRIVQATAAWSASINFEPLLSAVASTLTSLKGAVDAIGIAVQSIWQSKVLPFLTWVIQTALPALLGLLTNLFNYLAENPEVIQELIELVVAFVAAWKITQIILSVVKLVSELKPMAIILAVILTLVIKVIAAWGNMTTMEKVITVLGGVVVAAAAAAIAIGALQSALSMGIAAAAIVAGVLAITAAVNSATKRANSMSGVYSSGGQIRTSSLSNFPLDNLPHLASGAVISPNNEFLAVLGDQKAGTNIEAPLSTIKQALSEVLAERGGANGNAPIDLYIDGQKFARITGNYNSSETRRRGMNLVTGGAL